MDDVEDELNLKREGLVALAQLLGSDYTDGVHGVGIVNAMETIAAYGADDSGLQAFAAWVRAWRDKDADASDDDSARDEDQHRKARRQAFERKHRTVRRNWVLPEGFPSATVTDAYRKPIVDTSESPCEWARPDLQALRNFCEDKFGWSQAKADEHLLPVMTEFEKGLCQSRLDEHFSWQKRFAKVGSSRLASAIHSQTTGRSSHACDGKNGASSAEASGLTDGRSARHEADQGVDDAQSHRSRTKKKRGPTVSAKGGAARANQRARI